jgi:hypothetical protein
MSMQGLQHKCDKLTTSTLNKTFSYGVQLYAYYYTHISDIFQFIRDEIRLI